MKDSEVGETLVQACLQHALLANAGAENDYDDPVELTLTRGSSGSSEDGVDKGTLLPRNYSKQAKPATDKWPAEQLCDDIEVSHRYSEPHPEPGPGGGRASSPSSATPAPPGLGADSSSSSSSSRTATPSAQPAAVLEERTLPAIKQTQQAFPHPQSQPGLLHRMHPQSIVQQAQHRGIPVASSVHQAPSPLVGTNTPTNPSLGRVSSSVASGDRPVSECTLFSDYKDLDLELQQGSRRPLAGDPNLMAGMRTREVLQNALDDCPAAKPPSLWPSPSPHRDVVAAAAAVAVGSIQQQPAQAIPPVAPSHIIGSPRVAPQLPPIAGGFGHPAAVPSISAVPVLPGRPTYEEARERDRRAVPLYLRMQQKFDDLERQKLDFAKERRHAELLVQAVPVHIVAPRRKRQVRPAAGQKKAPRRRRPKVSAFVAPPQGEHIIPELHGASPRPQQQPLAQEQASPSLPPIAKAKAKAKPKSGLDARTNGPKASRVPSKEGGAGVVAAAGGGTPSALPQIALAPQHGGALESGMAPDMTRLPAALS
eukprot:CAMPEP_0206592980 /NCGR_PEP_ID=MMETSP0325_2-20121206/41326_1 /ASSEMBLY_ACC=CAM_ASM_000347 /TAXON_ID=2866 /ORGANISM="Crypthecodinium cohnii, Strain Seligo" /LENGTH=537 /DNA_ID=CAMNT_0054102803 /DNA_START=3 /DNA_END=1616 /DNA_ORIENTATION=+